jgi:sterol 14-demethylase
MRGHAQKIATEVEDMVARWKTEGEIDLLDFFAELTIYTSSSCLIGKKFRDQLDRRFADLYHDLERGTDAIAYVDPHAPIESFRRRDAARAGLVELVEGIMASRKSGPPATDEDRDLLDVLVSVPADTAGERTAGEPKAASRFNADEITGIFISMMFAGHHTTSGTAAWTLIELLRHPAHMEAVTKELDDLFADGADVSYQALREMPLLESAIKEALRLHPPLILLLRVAKEPLSFGGFGIEAGTMVGVSPAISNRIAGDFADPDSFVPERYLDPRREDLENPWTWIPFGAGKHRCVGASFAVMQLKAIFSVLLRGWTFELAQPEDSYRNDHSKMVVQLQQPCAARYRVREVAS